MICSDAKREWGAESNGTLPQPCFLSLRWKTCLLQNFKLSSCACSEDPALGLNNHDDDNDMFAVVITLKCILENLVKIFLGHIDDGNNLSFFQYMAVLK